MNSEPTLSACPICGTAGEIKPRRGPFTVKYNRLPIVLEDVEFYRCGACGEEFFGPKQEREVSRQIKAAARRRLGVLAPERIVAIRERLGLSQDALEDLLGLGEKVVTRWENGRVVPGRAVDYMLRLLERRPELVDELRAIRRETRDAEKVDLE